MLEIKNLHVELEDGEKQILKGVNLTVEAGKVHAIMGPNGSGKSTLSYVLSGRDGYSVTEGSATLEGTDLLEMEPEERAAAGLFLAFQYPVEIPGVSFVQFLRESANVSALSCRYDVKVKIIRHFHDNKRLICGKTKNYGGMLMNTPPQVWGKRFDLEVETKPDRRAHARIILVINDAVIT